MLAVRLVVGAGAHVALAFGDDEDAAELVEHEAALAVVADT